MLTKEDILDASNEDWRDLAAFPSGEFRFYKQDIIQPASIWCLTVVTFHRVPSDNLARLWTAARFFHCENTTQNWQEIREGFASALEIQMVQVTEFQSETDKLIAIVNPELTTAISEIRNTKTRAKESVRITDINGQQSLLGVSDDRMIIFFSC